MPSSVRGIGVVFSDAVADLSSKYGARAAQFGPAVVMSSTLVAFIFILSTEYLYRDIYILLYLFVLLLVAMMLGTKSAFFALLAFGAWEGLQQQEWTFADLVRASFVLAVGLFIILVRPTPGIQVDRARAAAAALRRELEEAKDNAQQLRDVFAQAPIGLACVGLDGRWLEVNDRFGELLGYSREELRRRTFVNVTHPEDLPGDQAQIFTLFTGDTGRIVRRKRYIRSDGKAFWATRAGRLVRTAEGQPSYFVVAVEDISREMEVTERRREQFAAAGKEVDDLAFALRVPPLATFEFSAEAPSRLVPRGANVIPGPPGADKLPLDGVFARVAAQDRPALEHALNTTASEEPLDIVFITHRNAMSDPWLRPTGREVRAGAEQLTGVVLDDVAPLHEGSWLSSGIDRDLMVKELTHRLANIFPVILTMVRMTAEHHPGGASLAEALQHRIKALSLTHGLLARRSPSTWSISELVRLEIEPYEAGDRVTLVGPDVTLTLGMAESFGIIVHELATNSAKYGALRSHLGLLDVAWHMIPNGSTSQVVFEWIERNGSPPDPASTLGFGASVLGFASRPIVGSEASFHRTADGIHYTLTMQVERGSSCSGLS